MENSKLEEIINLFWKIPSHYNLELPFEKQEGLHLEYLIGKYGKKTVDEYKRLGDAAHREQTKESSFNAYEFGFETGMYQDAAPNVAYRSILDLKSLLKLLGKREKFTVTDLGAGDGRISIALALLLENIEKIYAIDIVKPALKQMDLSKKLLPKTHQKKLDGRVVPVLGDYTDCNFKDKFNSKFNSKADIVLSLYPFDLFEVFEHGLDFLNIGGSILNFMPQPFEESEASLDYIKEEVGMWARTFWYNMEIVDHFSMPKGQLIVASEFKPAKTFD